MSKFRGMTGCFRQAVVDAGLENKIEVKYTTIYNDKQPNNERRFNWERCVVKKLTKKEEDKYVECLSERLDEFDLQIKPGFYIGKPFNYKASITIVTVPSNNGNINRVRAEAKELGYRLVKI